ncbi:NAD-dependent epimerase/dehydratase family protein [Halosimplex marinum]|uniref:NAD-dependent epimerase/dehydratase family protein n=1 Tax=Halosimplex marinum TaxID=3396620 RepID=UPI003F54631D
MGREHDSVVITGGTGFIGRRLTEALLGSDMAVHVVSHGEPPPTLRDADGVRTHVADVRDRSAVTDLLGRVAPDTVVHLAARDDTGSERGRFETVETNVMGTYNVLSAAARSGVERVVYASSAYRRGAVGDEPSPIDVYGASKAAGEQLCRAVASQSGIDCVVPVVHTVYGPSQPPTDGLVPAAAAAAVAGEDFAPNCPDHVRDFVHVADVVAFLRAAMEADTERSFERAEVCSGRGRRVRAVAERIYEVADAPGEVRPASDADCSRTPETLVGDPSGAAALCDWSPTVDWETGIEQVLSARR